MGIQTVVRTRMYPMRLGELVKTSAKGITEPFVNDAPRAAQVATYTVSGVVDSTVYTLQIDGVAISITSDATATDQEINDALVAAINAEPLVNGRVIAVGTAATTFTVTARYGGVAFVATESDANLTLAQTTANDEADPVPFGRAVVKAGLGTGPANSGLATKRLGRLASATALTAQVDELDLTYDAAVSALITIRYYDPTIGDWVTREFEHTMATDADTSIIALAGLINGQMPASTVIATHPTADTLTLTAEVAGVPFEVSYGFGTGEDTGVWVHTTNRTAYTDVTKALAGVAIFEYDVETTDDGGLLDAGTTQYEKNSVMSVARVDSDVCVYAEAAVTEDDPVFVRLVASGALDKLGAFTPTPGAGVVRVPNWEWVRQSQDNLAVLRVQR